MKDSRKDESREWDVGRRWTGGVGVELRGVKQNEEKRGYGNMEEEGTADWGWEKRKSSSLGVRAQ